MFLLLAHYVRFPGSFDTKPFRYKLKSIWYDIPKASTKTLKKIPGPKFNLKKIPGGGGHSREVWEEVRRRGLQTPILFKTKIAHFATLFKSGDTTFWLWCICFEYRIK